MNWNKITDIKELEEIAAISATTTVLLFKHSTSCYISKMVLKSFEQEYDIPSNLVQPYYLDLLEHRDISNAIAEKFSVEHQSPQVLLIKQGASIYDASHQSISVSGIKELL